ncbi:MAG TPA: EamA family transporter, partial [Firmicutes bacterium]|nr:EamA family transporter [Bacillota bacterium]
LGIVYGLLTAVCYAVSSNCIRRGQALGFPRFHGIVVAYSSGLIYVLVYMTASGKLGVFAKTPPRFFWLLFVAGVFSFLATACMYTALRLSPVSKVVPINACYPMAAALLAKVLLGDYLNGLMVAGILMVAVGVTVSQLPSRRAVVSAAGAGTPERVTRV